MKFILTLVLFSLFSCAHEKATSQYSFLIDPTEYAKTNLHHNALKDFVGTWKYQARFWSAPDAKPQLYEGTNVMEMIYDGKFLRYQSKSKGGAE